MTGCALGDSPPSSNIGDGRLGHVAQADQLPDVVVGTSEQGVQLVLDVASDHVGIKKLSAGGRAWLDETDIPSPLFEVAGPDRGDGARCIWASNGAGVEAPLRMAVSVAKTGDTTRINAELWGCAEIPRLDVALSMHETGGQIRMEGSIKSAVLDSTSVWGWSGPFVLGDMQGTPSIFGADAHVAAVRSRAVYPVGYCPQGSSPTCQQPTTSVREEAFVVGFDGIIYGSQEVNDSPWTLPAPLYDAGASQNRDVFPPGAPLAALRRNDDQTDLFAVSAGGGELAEAAHPHRVGPQLMTVYRVGANAAWSPPQFIEEQDGPLLRARSPLAALSLHEEFDTRWNEQEVYVPSLDGRIYWYRESNNGGWTHGIAVDLSPDPRTPASPFCQVPTDVPVHIAAVARNHRQRDLFFIDTRGRLCESFKLRATERPEFDDKSVWASARAISLPNRFVPGAPVAAAHGSGNSEHVFAIGKDGHLYAAEEIDDSGWSEPAAMPSTGGLSPTASIAAARRSARDVVVSFVGQRGEVLEARSIEGGWSQPTIILGLAGSPARKLALSLRKPEQLDVFSTGGNGDGRLWSSGDGFGRFDVRLVLPRLLFPDGKLLGARGMIPAEMGGDSSLKKDGCNAAPNKLENAGKGCALGMPYANVLGDSRSQQIGLPQSTNIMELAHITKDNASFFVADISPPIETGRSPAQLIASQAEVSGLWTRELYPGTSVLLPSIVFGGYPSADWHPAVDAYTAAHVDDPAPVDTPAWLRNAGAMFTFSAGGAGGIYLSLPGAQSGFSLADYAAIAPAPGFGGILRKMFTDAQSMGTNIVYLYDYWAKDGSCGRVPYNTPPFGAPYFCKGDYRVRCDFGDIFCPPNNDYPALISLKQAIAAVQDDGARVILYVEPFIWGFGPDVMNQYQDLFWAREPSGQPWVPFQQSVALSYAHSGWQDRFVELTRKLVADTNADGVFLDSGAWRLNERVQTKDEVVRASPLEHARALLDLADRVRVAVRDVRPRAKGPAVVMTETVSGPAARHFDGGVSADFSPLFSSGAALAESFDPNGNLVDAALRATPTRYAMRGVNIFGNGTTLNQLQQVYAAGHNLALARDYGVDGGFMSRNASYINRLVRTRIAHADALVDGAQSPLPVIGQHTNVIARRYTPVGPQTSVTKDVITVVNVGGDATIVALDVTDVPGAGPHFCDVIEGKGYDAVGGLLSANMPATACTPDGTKCEGLRVFVREPCRSEEAAVRSRRMR